MLSDLIAALKPVHEAFSILAISIIFSSMLIEAQRLATKSLLPIAPKRFELLIERRLLP